MFFLSCYNVLIYYQKIKKKEKERIWKCYVFFFTKVLSIALRTEKFNILNCFCVCSIFFNDQKIFKKKMSKLSKKITSFLNPTKNLTPLKNSVFFWSFENLKCCDNYCSHLIFDMFGPLIKKKHFFWLELKIWKTSGPPM